MLLELTRSFYEPQWFMTTTLTKTNFSAIGAMYTLQPCTHPPWSRALWVAKNQAKRNKQEAGRKSRAPIMENIVWHRSPIGWVDVVVLKNKEQPVQCGHLWVRADSCPASLSPHLCVGQRPAPAPLQVNTSCWSMHPRGTEQESELPRSLRGRIPFT